MDNKFRHTFKNRFSIGHPEKNMQECPNHFYLMMKQTPQETLDEIEDIYFGKFFYYEYDGKIKRYGNCMGEEATDAHIDNLFKLQAETGVTISLTMNALEIPGELQMDQRLVDAFVEWIGQFYDRGLRSCTIAWKHLMRSGYLQKRCPEMRWKNTVNHIISDTQQVVETLHLGYDTILLDRSFNRNVNELKKVKKVIDKYNAIRKSKNPNAKELKTSLLVSEGCLYRCPFKLEHDDIGSTIAGDYFSTLSTMTCDNWRNPEFSDLPRNGVDIAAQHIESLNLYLDNVNILKHSGRLVSYRHLSEAEIISKNIHYGWVFSAVDTIARKRFNGGVTDKIISGELLTISTTYQHAYNLDAAPLSEWTFNHVFGNIEPHMLTAERYEKMKEDFLGENIWMTEKGRRLENILLNCKSQCYDCHECEKTFGSPEIDSALQYKYLV